MKTNIVLIGFMGTGKTAVGQLLAKNLNRKFIELDRMIEQQAGKTIPDIFRDEGEIAFREKEIEATRQIASERNCVIACGGGIVLNKINTDRLREGGVIIQLTASPEIILKRTSKEVGARPLLDVDSPARAIEELMKFRKPFYDSAADISVNTSKMDLEGVVQEIIGKLNEDESFDFQQ